jgi:hypothetical protein
MTARSATAGSLAYRAADLADREIESCSVRWQPTAHWSLHPGQAFCRRAMRPVEAIASAVAVFVGRSGGAIAYGGAGDASDVKQARPPSAWHPSGRRLLDNDTRTAAAADRRARHLFPHPGGKRAIGPRRVTVGG